MSDDRRHLRRRAIKIKKASKPKSRPQEYLQYAIVIIVIFVILVTALVLTDSF